MRNAGVSGKEVIIWRKDFAGVDTGEGTGFRDRMEDLRESSAMNRKVVDRFVGADGPVGDEGSLRKHCENGTGVRGGKWFLL